MNRNLSIISGLWADQRGQAATEYILVMAVLACGMAAAFFVLVPGLRTAFVNLAGKIASSGS